jgi:hypothetical protein
MPQRFSLILSSPSPGAMNRPLSQIAGQNNCSEAKFILQWNYSGASAIPF